MDTMLDNHDANITGQLGEKLVRLKNDFKEVIGLARSLAGDKLTGLKDYALDSGKAAASSVATSIKENPIRSAIVAAGVGVLIGFLVSRR